jgi:FdhD protein
MPATGYGGALLESGEQSMKEETENFRVLQVVDQHSSRIEGTVVREFSLTIVLNNQELVTLLCSPTNLRCLAAGFLLSEGFIKGKGDIKRITVDDENGAVCVETEGHRGSANRALLKRLITSGGGRGTYSYSAPEAKGTVASDIEISPSEVFALMDGFVQRSGLYKATGGVHSAALCDRASILFFAEDIGRHNAVDKIFGHCILEDISTDERLVITSGRISSEILLKVAKGNIPIIISKSAPTNLAVRLANDFGITLIGFVRGRSMNAYTNDWRLVTHGE